MDQKITVVINTYNASVHLREVIESVKCFDEILVCDMESTDDTLSIARAYGCRIVTFPRRDYNIVEPARDFAIRQAACPWVLVVDADEVVPSALAGYLYAMIARSDCPAGLYIPRKNYFMGRFMHCHYPDPILRFFRKEGTVWPPVIHSVPRVQGVVQKIPGRHKELAFVHLANDTVSDILRKTDQYTRNELAKKKDKRYGKAAFVYRPFFRFFKGYVLKGGWRDGLPGFIRAALDGYYQFVMLSKLYEARRQCGHSTL